MCNHLAQLPLVSIVEVVSCYCLEIMAQVFGVLWAIASNILWIFPNKACTACCTHRMLIGQSGQATTPRFPSRVNAIDLVSNGCPTNWAKPEMTRAATGVEVLLFRRRPYWPPPLKYRYILGHLRSRRQWQWTLWACAQMPRDGISLLMPEK